MGSPIVPLAIGESLHTFAESGRGPRVGIRHYSGGNAVQKGQPVEFVKERLGSGHRARGRVGKRVQNRLRELIELTGRENPRYETELAGLVGFEDAPRADEIECLLRTHRAAQ